MVTPIPRYIGLQPIRLCKPNKKLSLATIAIHLQKNMP
jgi:hypothetical protein